MRVRNVKKRIIIAVFALGCMVWNTPLLALATEDTSVSEVKEESSENKSGGGYAVSGQLDNVGYSAKLYDAENGLPTSDANCIFTSSKGYIWIGGYSGIIRYDGNEFERLDSTNGLTSGRAIFEDSKGRIWVGTNDNGIVRLEDEDARESTRFTYKDGIPSSTIRGFCEDPEGVIYVGTTSGMCYIDANDNVELLDDTRINNEYVVRMISDERGVIYVSTQNGDVFSIKDGKVKDFYSSEDLGIGQITTIYADQNYPGMLYFGTDTDKIYYGKFGLAASNMKEISVESGDISWITSACDRIWIATTSKVGYLDSYYEYHELNSAIEMVVADYQGNLWCASSRQGVMKVVTNNYQNLFDISGLEPEVVNTTCWHEDNLYIGTDKGLRILDKDYHIVENNLQTYIGESRIRCAVEDQEGNLWLCTYTDGKGLVCYDTSHNIISYTEENGFLSNETRCATVCSNGKLLVGTNDGFVVMVNGKVTETYGADVLDNTMILTLEEGEDNDYLVGTDGDGMYDVSKSDVQRYSRDDGLTSDVILRIKKDEARNVYWIVTSNSIEFMKNGRITNVDHFPYNNNFDIYYDTNENLWVLSSYGVFCVNAFDMLENKSFDYRLYTMANGLSSVPTANSFSCLDVEGNLYISGRSCVNRVNINHYYDQDTNTNIYLKYINCDDEAIYPGDDGAYHIPSDVGRIYFYTSVLDYSMSNPTIKLYFDGGEEDAVTMKQSELSPLEYTGFSHGN